MAWLAVDKDNTEIISSVLPLRTEYGWECCSENCGGWVEDYSIELPKGSIKKLIGKDITWNDEPIRI